MTRIAGINVPKNKLVKYSLCYITGIGQSTADKIVREFKIKPNIRMGDLPEDIVVKIRDYISQKLVVEGDLRARVMLNIKKKIELGSYQGLRHRAKLPVNGQKTHNNARTRKGKAVAIAGKKK